jgi:hypothetical protein
VKNRLLPVGVLAVDFSFDAIKLAKVRKNYEPFYHSQ